MPARILRASAVLIALLAVVDPALTTARRVPAEVAVVRGDAGGAPTDPDAAYESVFAAVSERFDAVGGPWPAAAATVLVGGGLPEGADALPVPVFRVVPTPAESRTRIVRLDLPARVPLDATVRGSVLLTPARGDADSTPPVEVVLLDGDRELDRVRAVSVGPGGAELRAEVSFVPPGPGVQTVTVALVHGAGEPRPILKRVIEVDESRWRVVFLDGRPSWPSTFARRALDQDSRFDLSGRIETSPGFATTFGEPPADPDGAGTLEGYDVVVVGAPDALSATRVAALDRWVRVGGGTLILLPDAVAIEGGSTALWQELAGGDQWEERALDTEITVTTEVLETGSIPLFLAHTLVGPRVLPRGARVLARDAEGAPVVWERSQGLGTIVVSGAVDAWQFRDPDRSGFEAGWRGLIGRAAAARAPDLELRLEPGGHPTRAAPPLGSAPGGGVAAPVGAPVQMLARLPADTASLLASASLVHESGAVLPLSIGPGRDPLSLESRFSAPPRPGVWRLVLDVDGRVASVPLVVDPVGAPKAAGGDGDDALIEAWVESRGGVTLEGDRLDDLVGALEATVGVERRPERWHPMRSPWWIIPFALALAGEWWLRRRRGLP